MTYPGAWGTGREEGAGAEEQRARSGGLRRRVRLERRFGVFPRGFPLCGPPGAVLGKARTEKPGFGAEGVGRWSVCGSDCLSGWRAVGGGAGVPS